MIVNFFYKFLHGQMTGITSDITIPFVAAPHRSMDFLSSQRGIIHAFEFPAISSKGNCFYGQFFQISNHIYNTQKRKPSQTL
jgi:hypothetical protein